MASYAFRNCTNLITVEMPDSITEVGNACFMGNSKLENVKLSNNLKILNDQIFSVCTDLKVLELPENLEQIDDLNAYGGTGLTTNKIT